MDKQNEICPDCGGRIEKGTCICSLSEKIYKFLLKQFKLTDNKLQNTIDDSSLQIVACTRETPNDNITIKTTSIFKSKAKIE